MSPHADTFKFTLDEANQELQSLIEGCNSANLMLKAEEIEHKLAEIFWHLSMAFNARDLSLCEVAALPEEEFRQLGVTTPSFVGLKK